MALFITDECINCDACISECPNNAIYEPDQEWSLAEETALEGIVITPRGEEMDAEAQQEALSDEFYFIVADKCTECKGFHENPQCVSVCPVDCIHPREDMEESEEMLLEKKVWLHGA